MRLPPCCSSSRSGLSGATATRILDGIEGAYGQAQLGSQQAREGKTLPLDELQRRRST